VITSISPGAIAPGTTVDFQFNGFGFAPGMTVNAGSGITATVTSVPTALRATVRFVAAAGATLGSHDVTVINGVGTSAPIPLLVTNLPPTLTSISPSTFGAGAGNSITVSGSNFTKDVKLQADSSITFSFVTAVSDTLVTASISVDSAASFGPHDIVAVTTQGTSNAIPITVTPSQPSLLTITPSFGGKGSSTIVTLLGSHFRAPLTLDVGSADITVSNLVITDTSHLTATLNISSNATLGNRNISVTTPGGTTPPRTFNVVPPFPDLTVTDITAPARFFQGYPETYSVTVRNLGLAPTSGTTTLTHSISAVVLSSASGPGWNCSITSNGATCQTSLPIPAGGSSTLTFAGTLPGGISGGTFAGFSVSNAGDLTTGNNGASPGVTLNSFPNLTISFSPQLSKSGIQSQVTLSSNTSLFPHDLSGNCHLASRPIPQLGLTIHRYNFQVEEGRFHSLYPPIPSRRFWAAGQPSLCRPVLLRGRSPLEVLWTCRRR
jgi:hypothetical protein